MTVRSFALICTAAALLATAAGASAAGWRSSLNTAAGSGISIEASSPINGTPQQGCAPYWISINNRSGAARTWKINAMGGAGYNRFRNTSVYELSVPNGETARLSVLAPGEPRPRGDSSYMSNYIRVDGYGTERSIAFLPSVGYSSKIRTPFVGMGETLAIPLWEGLKHEFDSPPSDTALTGSPVNVALLSTDWRAYTCFECLWLTEAEYAGLEVPQRMAIRNWIDRGGIFYLCTQTLDPALRASLGLGETGSKASPGFGYVELIPWDGKSLPMEAAFDWINTIKSIHANPYDGNDPSFWPLVKSVGSIPLNAWFLICFIVTFAILIGPVNLFALAGADRRHRLFWTTPLISLIASLLLVVVIIFKDGFGGKGERVMLSLLFPDQKKALVIQEQASRTGVLLSRGFTMSDDLLLLPLAVSNSSDPAHNQAGREYGGDWFSSRSIQAQRVEAIVPSRAGIQLLNAEATRGGAAPVVVSSIPAALRSIQYIDLEGHHWVGGNLRTGERITLRKDPNAAYHKFNSSEYLYKLGERAANQPGNFYAQADNGPFFETLRSIRWQKQEAVFLGPVTSIP